VKKVLIICHTDLDRDPRVQKQINFLKDDYEITAAGMKDPNVEGVKFIKLPYLKFGTSERLFRAFLLLFRLYDAHYKYFTSYQESIKLLNRLNFDIILANEIESIQLALSLKNKDTMLILDMYEYYPAQLEYFWWWRLLFSDYYYKLIKNDIRNFNIITTVSSGLQYLYEKEFGIRPELITNAPFYEKLEPSPVDPDKIRLIYHGVINRARKIENIINMMDYLDDRFELNFMILIRNDRKYFEELKELAKSKKNNRIIFHEASPANKLVKNTNQFDIGIYYFEPTTRNLYYTIGNKFFEYIQARLAVVSNPLYFTKEYKDIVVSKEHSPKSFAVSLNSLSSQDIIELKQRSHEYALDLSAEMNRKKMLNIVK